MGRYHSKWVAVFAAGGVAGAMACQAPVNSVDVVTLSRNDGNGGDSASSDSTTSDAATPSDTTPPVLSAGAPTGIQPAGTTQATLSVNTNESATCKWSNVANTSFASMANTFSVTGDTNHTTTVTGLSNGQSYTYYLRCRDISANANSTDYIVGFSVSDSGDTQPPNHPGTPQILLFDLDSNFAYFAVNWTQAVDPPSGNPVPTYALEFAYDDGRNGSQLEVTTTSTQIQLPYEPSGGPQLAFVCVWAKDASGNLSIDSACNAMTVPGKRTLSPVDTYINADANVYYSDTMLRSYTWPANQVANVILMQFNLSIFAPNAVIQRANLNLVLVETDAQTEPLYSMSVHRIVNVTPVLTAATGFTYDGTNNWTASACCYNGIPMAQSDISAAYDTVDVDKVISSVKSWNITYIIQEWIDGTSTNRGLLLNADTGVGADRWRYFGSTKNGDTAVRPYLEIYYQ